MGGTAPTCCARTSWASSSLEAKWKYRAPLVTPDLLRTSEMVAASYPTSSNTWAAAITMACRVRMARSCRATPHLHAALRLCIRTGRKKKPAGSNLTDTPPHTGWSPSTVCLLCATVHPPPQTTKPSPWFFKSRFWCRAPRRHIATGEPSLSSHRAHLEGVRPDTGGQAFLKCLRKKPESMHLSPGASPPEAAPVRPGGTGPGRESPSACRSRAGGRPATGRGTARRGVGRRAPRHRWPT